MNNENIARLKDAYKAFASGDLDAVTKNWSPDIIWHAGSVGPISGDYKGKDEVLGFFASLMQESGGTFKLDVRHMIADDEYGFALVQTTMERNGKRADQLNTHCFRLEDGKVVEFWGFTADAQQTMDIWS
jgi:ketosteroid isomerase-like protein